MTGCRQARSKICRSLQACYDLNVAKLTDKRRHWIEAYLGEALFNATEAARIAGYAHPNVAAARIVKASAVREAIEERLADLAMSADEVIARLSEQGRATVADFVTINPDGDRVSIDPGVVEQRGHLIKKIKANTTVKFSKKGDQIEYTTIEIELYDAQRALALLAKVHGLMQERVEHTGAIDFTLKVRYGDPDARTDGQTKKPPLLAAPDSE